MKEISKVYETNNYSLFKNLYANREVTKARKNKIRDSISRGEVFNPIVVNSHMEIIDGQGRFEARKELGLPIHYIIDNSATIEDCRRMNLTSTNWSIRDFIKSHAETGNGNCRLLMQASEEFGITVQTLLRIKLSKGSPNFKQIQEGKVIFNHEDYLHAAKVDALVKRICAGNCLDIKKPKREMYCAISKILTFRELDVDRLVRNCTAKRNDFVETRNVVDQLKEFSKFYNYGAKRKIHFED